MTYAGDIAEGEAALAPLRAIGTPIADGVSPHPYTAWQAAFDQLLGPGARNYWKSHDLMELEDATIELMVRAAETLPDDECEIFTAHSANQSRLEAIKQRNDPRNLFRANVIISPASNDQQEMPRLRRPRHSHRNVTARPRKGSYGLLKL